MKKLNFLPLLAVLMLFFAAPNYAQKNTNVDVDVASADGTKTVTIIKKYIDENGVETVEQTTRTITSEEGSESRFYFNSDDDNIQISGMEDIEILTNEISDQLAELEIEFDNENVFLYNGSSNGKKSSCHSGPVPFLGVVTNSTDDGALITEVVSGSAAEAAGLKAGDKITSLAGKTTNRSSELGCAIKKQKVGENVTVKYIRNGQNMSTTAKLTARKDKRTVNIWSDDRAKNFMRGHNNHRSYSYSNNYKVDPCKVFIGVYTSSSTHQSGEGLRVNGIIDDTPAQEAGLQQGDVIIAMDGINVNNHRELLSQRNTHSQGDEFTVTYKRDGNYYTVGAEFKSCKEDEPTLTTPPAEVRTEEASTPQTFTEQDTKLDIDLLAFPNPSNRVINVRFEGDAVPTTVSITDVNGKEVFREYSRNFNGYYNEKIDLREAGAAQGTVIITVTQNGKATSEKLLYIQGRA